VARIITEETTLKNVVGSLEKESSVLGGIKSLRNSLTSTVVRCWALSL